MNIQENELEKYLSGLFACGFFSLITSGIAWRLGFYQFPGKKSSSDRIKLGDLLGAFCVFLGIALFSSPAALFLETSLSNGEWIEVSSAIKIWKNVFAIVLSNAGLLCYFFTRSRHTQKAIWSVSGFSKIKKTSKDFFLGVTTWLVSYPLVTFFGQLISIIIILGIQATHQDQTVVEELKIARENPRLFFITSLLIVSIVPITEELLFRGFLQTWIKGVLGRGKAIVLTALVFAFFHFSLDQGLDNIEILCSLFVLSCFLGFLYERQRSLWAPIGLHATFNAVTVCLIFLEET